MARTASEMSRWIEEVLSISQAAYELNVRAQKLRRKTASGGYYTEPAPEGWTGAPIAEIRAVFNLIVVDLTNMFDSTEIGTGDRTSAYWQANPGAGI